MNGNVAAKLMVSFKAPYSAPTTGKDSLSDAERP